MNKNNKEESFKRIHKEIANTKKNLVFKNIGLQ